MLKLQDEKETAGLASVLARVVPPGKTVGLVGALGSGKTTLVRHWVSVLGCSDVSSPTFVLAHYYETPTCTIEHWDLYRLRALPDELLEPPDRWTVRIIEWADRFKQEIPLDLEIRLTTNTDNVEERSVAFSGPLTNALEVELKASSR